LRVIGGTFGGRKLNTREGIGTRPPLEAVRQAIFNMLSDHLEGSVVLDLFAGSGSMGIEAISRGAKACVMVENNRQALSFLRQNLKDLELESQVDVLGDRLPGVFSHPKIKEAKFNIVLIDPPFDAVIMGEFLNLKDLLFDNIAAGGFLVQRLPERCPKAPLSSGYELFKERRYGISVVEIWRKSLAP
jgi:16S rRNA (guanine966-N2)-methyltransferase